jgi:hypothetical protein
LFVVVAAVSLYYDTDKESISHPRPKEVGTCAGFEVLKAVVMKNTVFRDYVVLYPRR